ncbi:DivIVA domain-containing protein [Lentzea sp. NPDC060358]|uniref:DivIVA domain-containing protein n=1 Tax=Lentzea sp. NPDC060358 TaxID=3347103 RepID=UPI003654F507
MEDSGVFHVEPAGGQDRFAVVFRGYDRQQVDEYVQALQERAARLEKAVRDGVADLPEHADLDVPGAAAGIGSRIERVLKLAEAEAAELRDDALRECSELCDEAKRFKEDTERSARTEALRIVANAEGEAAELRAATRAIFTDLARVEATIRSLRESGSHLREQNVVSLAPHLDAAAGAEPGESPVDDIAPPSPRRAGVAGKPRSPGPASMPQRRKSESKA